VKKIEKIIATWFGIGLIPVAPGTLGSAGAFPILFLLRKTRPVFKFLFLIFFIILATAISQRAKRLFEEDDPKQIVIDEVAGMLVAAIFLPFSFKNILFAFLIFRLFDITKPPPVKRIEKIKGGIIFDDLIAGLFTFIIMKGIFG